MLEHEAFYKTIHAEYKAINDALIVISKEQVKCNAENAASFDSIDRHLGRINGTIDDHSEDIDNLKDFVKVHEVLNSLETDIKKETMITRRLIFVALLGLAASIILNFIF